MGSRGRSLKGLDAVDRCLRSLRVSARGPQMTSKQPFFGSGFQLRFIEGSSRSLWEVAFHRESFSYRTVGDARSIPWKRDTADSIWTEMRDFSNAQDDLKMT